MTRNQKSQVFYPTKHVFAAACAAERINGDYVSSVDESSNKPEKSTNKSLMLLLLNNSLEITEEDRAKADLVIRNYQALSFKLLGGKTLNEFESKSMELATGEQVAHRDIGVVAYLPVGYNRAEASRKIDQQVRECEAKYCGAVGDKVNLNVEVIRIIFSHNWGCYFITAVTKDNLAVSFAFSKQLELNKTYQIKAKVKEHNEKFVTKLNFVKLA